MSTPTLEERARTLAEKIHGGSMTEIALFVAEHVYKERRAAQVEALERAAGEARDYAPKIARLIEKRILALAERVKNGETI